jgi:hypothetical protein
VRDSTVTEANFKHFGAELGRKSSNVAQFGVQLNSKSPDGHGFGPVTHLTEVF